MLHLPSGLSRVVRSNGCLEYTPFFLMYYTKLMYDINDEYHTLKYKSCGKAALPERLSEFTTNRSLSCYVVREELLLFLIYYTKPNTRLVFDIRHLCFRLLRQCVVAITTVCRRKNAISVRSMLSYRLG